MQGASNLDRRRDSGIYYVRLYVPRRLKVAVESLAERASPFFVQARDWLGWLVADTGSEAWGRVDTARSG